MQLLRCSLTPWVYYWNTSKTQETALNLQLLLMFSSTTSSVTSSGRVIYMSVKVDLDKYLNITAQFNVSF